MKTPPLYKRVVLEWTMSTSPAMGWREPESHEDDTYVADRY